MRFSYPWRVEERDELEVLVALKEEWEGKMFQTLFGVGS